MGAHQQREDYFYEEQLRTNLAGEFPEAYQPAKLRRAWDSRGTFASGSTCYGFMNNKGAQNTQKESSQSD